MKTRCAAGLVLSGALALLPQLVGATTLGSGAYDTTFGDGGRLPIDFGAYEGAHSMALQPDGRIVLAGGKGGSLYPSSWALARLLPNSAFDASFGSLGLLTPIRNVYGSANVVKIAADGKIMTGGWWAVGGNSGVLPLMARWNADGSADSSFGAGGQVLLAPATSSDGLIDIDQQADGKWLALGTNISRINADGSIDATVDGSALQLLQQDRDAGRTIRAQADGTILIGRRTQTGIGFARLASTFTLTTLATVDIAPPANPGYPGPVSDGGYLVVQADGNIVVAGSTNDGHVTLARFHPDGSVDATFGVNGLATVDGEDVRGLALAADGKIFAVTTDFTVMRFTTQGNLDDTFGTGGKFIVFAGPAADAHAIAVQPDGQVLVAGRGSHGGDVDFYIARIDPSAPNRFGILSSSPAVIDLGDQSAYTRSPPVSVTLTNASGTFLTIDWTMVSAGFEVTGSTCTALAPGAQCSVSLRYVPGQYGLYGQWIAGNWPGELVASANGTTIYFPIALDAEVSLVAHFYQSILRRDPDPTGKAYWDGMQTKFSSYLFNDIWYAMAQTFFTSAEYAAFNRDDAGFIQDLYHTFFDRDADAAGQTYWMQQIASGMPREVVLASFMFSDEFKQLLQRISIGSTAGIPPPELFPTMDLYRGLLGRMPDVDGFNYWVGQFHAAACAAGGGQAVADRISSAFLQSAEYAARGHTDAQFVGDLYNAFLRRGGDLQGVLFWIGQLQSGAMTREQVRAQFVASPEFANRVGSIGQYGCAGGSVGPV
jgi:uncharacterized delta-60 repeat protein